MQTEVLVGFDFDRVFDEFVKAEAAAGRPIPELFQTVMRVNRVHWRFAYLIAKDVSEANGDAGIVPWPRVVDVIDRFPVPDDNPGILWPAASNKNE